MSFPLFLAEFGEVAPGDRVRCCGDEARHAVAARRIRIGETVLLADGSGRAVEGPVVVADKAELVIEAVRVLTQPERGYRLVAVQALAKGDRADLAVELLTELGVDEIVAWQAERSIVRWTGDRAEKSLGKWQSTAREAAKQSRRFVVPQVSFATTAGLVERLRDADLVLVLHEEATNRLSGLVRDRMALGTPAEIVVVTGPEGGISPQELAVFADAGGVQALLADHVLRTSTAGGVALAQVQAVLSLPR